MRTLEKLTIKNFKSIRDQSLELGRLNVFIGANGSGKSNLIGAFRFLQSIVNSNLAVYTALRGGADSLLYFGRKRSSNMALSFEFADDLSKYAYSVSLNGADDDSLIIETEGTQYQGRDETPSPFDYWDWLGGGRKESALRKTENARVRQVADSLDDCRIYHFHDTSDTATLKGMADVDDNRILRPHAENLAAFLFWMQERQSGHFEIVEDTIRQIAPFFEGFRLQPSRLNESKIRLEWKEIGNDSYFNASSFSDGTLRFICLATLLLQPKLPMVVLLDEPELGLHPAAITLLADLLLSASTRAQMLVATQSVTLVNQFEPGYVWTVERSDGQSVFQRLDEGNIQGWLDGYSLGELWEKNTLGARP